MQAPAKPTSKVLDLFAGLVITALILAFLETTLWSLDLGPPKPKVDLSRGFDPSAAYIVPSSQEAGGWETRFDSKDRKEIQLPPKTRKVRVLTFGGSNTAGFPIGVMRKRLASKLPRQSYEAFNLGRQGYGSSRVRLIFEQAVEKLDPQIVVIYAGHNEFIEKGFQMDLEEVGLGDLSKWASDLVGNTRLYQTALDYYSAGYVSPQTEPEAWKSEYNKFSNLTYVETQQFFDAYEQNLRDMCRTAQEHGVEVLLCTIVYNRLSVPFSSTFPDSQTPEQIKRFMALHQEARKQIPKYLAPLLATREKMRLQNRDWGPHGVGYKVGDDILESTRPCRAFLKGRPAMLETEETWTPKVRALDRCLKRFFARDSGELSRDDLKRAEFNLTEALKVCEDHPLAMFELGIVKYLLGRRQVEVLKLLEGAAAADRAPRKGSEAINDIIRKVAAEVPGVELYDVDRAFRACHPQGLVGYEWMVDYCHLNFGARWILMELLSDRIYKDWPPKHFRKETQ